MGNIILEAILYYIFAAVIAYSLLGILKLFGLLSGWFSETVYAMFRCCSVSEIADNISHLVTRITDIAFIALCIIFGTTGLTGGAVIVLCLLFIVIL